MSLKIKGQGVFIEVTGENNKKVIIVNPHIYYAGNNIKELKNRTCIMVTHRKAAMELCDWRLEMEQVQQKNFKINIVIFLSQNGNHSMELIAL